MITLLNKNYFSILLTGIICCYYLLFVNKGIVFSDEGLYVYTAEMIMQGHVPYIDFFLQYPPLYFYILGFLFKIFGPSIIAGRLLSLVICVGIFIAALKLIKSFKIYSVKAKLITLLCIASFGYPLINIPLLTWPTVFITILIMILLVEIQKKDNLTSRISMGLLLAMLFSIKQNIALTQIILVNIILLITLSNNVLGKIKTLFFINSIWICISFVWIYYFFLNNNTGALIEFYNLSARLSTIYPFNYPPLTMLFEPLGIIKLIPYYLPIIFLSILIFTLITNKKDKKLFILLLPLNGFFTTIYPVSELLHVYPYFGLILLSLYIYTFYYVKKYVPVFYIIIFLTVLIGFYLSLFREHYRYHAPYRAQTVPLNIPKAENLFIDNDNVQSITGVYSFLSMHTKKTDYIFAYPFSPMQYFIFDRKNPSRYPIYQEGYLTKDEENKTIKDIIVKKTKYIIVDGSYILPSNYNALVDTQKAAVKIGQFTIYELKHN